MVDVKTCILSSNFDFSSRIANFQTRSCIELDLSLVFTTSTTDFKSSLNLSIEFSIVAFQANGLNLKYHCLQLKSIKDVDLRCKGTK